MPRRPRIHIDGLPLHIVQRGHSRAACFLDEQDRLAYLGWLREALERERCSLHVYVLMTNYVLNQDQPIGNNRFYRKIDVVTGQRR